MLTIKETMILLHAYISVFVIAYIGIWIVEMVFCLSSLNRSLKSKELNKKLFEIAYDAISNYKNFFNIIAQQIFVIVCYLVIPIAILLSLICSTLNDINQTYRIKFEILSSIDCVLSFISCVFSLWFIFYTKKKNTVPLSTLDKIKFDNIINLNAQNIEITSQNKKAKFQINNVLRIFKRNVKYYNNAKSQYSKKTIELYVLSILEIFANLWILNGIPDFSYLIQIKMNGELIDTSLLTMDQIMLIFFNKFELMLKNK